MFQFRFYYFFIYIIIVSLILNIQNEKRKKSVLYLKKYCFDHINCIDKHKIVFYIFVNNIFRFT